MAIMIVLILFVLNEAYFIMIQQLVKLNLELASMLRDCKEMGSRFDDLVVYVDVDDTLVRTVGAKRIPITIAIDHVRALAANGAILYCWSSGGREYAKASAEELGIAQLF